MSERERERERERGKQPNSPRCEGMRFLQSVSILARLHEDTLIKLVITDSLGFSNDWMQI